MSNLFEMGGFSEILIENPDFNIDGILIEDAIFDDIEPDEASDPIYDVDVDEVGCFIVIDKETNK